tara:strand:+ start:128 stop:580 length:453 start_codon:yes stop_codon:yes gene_type:complete
MKFQVIRPFSIVTKGKAKTYALGQRIGESAYNRLSTRQQSYFLPARKCGKLNWTHAEYMTQAQGYILYGNDRAACFNHFRKFHTTHNQNAINFATYSCAALDTQNGLDGFKDYAQGLLDALNAIEPGRFQGNKDGKTVEQKLDSLLASLR